MMPIYLVPSQPLRLIGNVCCRVVAQQIPGHKSFGRRKMLPGFGDERIAEAWSCMEEAIGSLAGQKAAEVSYSMFPFKVDEVHSVPYLNFVKMVLVAEV